MKKINVPELELRILKVLWSGKIPLKVQDVLDKWLDEPKPGYTTILKKLQIMESKKLVDHEKSGRSYSYFPLIKKSEVTNQKFGNILNNIFGGNKLEMAASFVEGSNLSKEELDDFISLLQKEREK